MKYRNVGYAPWRRDDGTLVPPGAVFEATPREEARIARQPAFYPLAAVADGEPAGAPEAASEASAPEQADAGEAGAGEWPLRISPARYLAMHPDGRYAELARRLAESEA
jgi:hypothetical protein